MKIKMIPRTILYLVCTLLFQLLLSNPVLSDELSEFKAQMQEMQKENRTLQEQWDKQREEMKHLLERIEDLQKKYRSLEKKGHDSQESPMEPALTREDVPGSLDVPQLHIRGFGDVAFSAKFIDSGGESTFTLGSVDLYITSEITDRLSALVEANFNTSSETNEVTLRLERAHLKYSFSDFLNITLGKMHTPIGYWNQTYHHGNWLQTTIFRPEIAIPEVNNGAFLPIHQLGIDLSGVKGLGQVDLGYNLGVFNGRGRTVSEIQGAKDRNDSKAIHLHLHLISHFFEGMRLGANFFHDTIPTNPSLPARLNPIQELIVGGYFTYLHDRVEVIGELFKIFHEDKVTGQDFNTLGFYLQGGHKIGQWMPYYRFDFMNVANADPFFVPPRNNDRVKHTWGLRWDVFSWNAIKFEYHFTNAKDRSDEHQLAINSSFAF